MKLSDKNRERIMGNCQKKEKMRLNYSLYGISYTIRLMVDKNWYFWFIKMTKNGSKFRKKA